MRGGGECGPRAKHRIVPLNLIEKMLINQIIWFQEADIFYDANKRNTILDYLIDVVPLNQKDRILNYGGMNFSITGILKSWI